MIDVIKNYFEQFLEMLETALIMIDEAKTDENYSSEFNQRLEHALLLHKDRIASPLAYMKTNIEKEANNYYTKLLNVLDEKKPAELIDFCREQK